MKLDVAKCHACHLVPRLPRKVKVDVTKCHSCHAKSRGVHGDSWEPGAPPEPAQCRKCHACHVKRMWMWPSATPATWTKVDVAKCHACHAKWRWMSPSATPATQRAAASTASAENPPSAVSATPATWNECGCDQVPRLPRKEPRRPRRQLRTRWATRARPVP